MSNLVKKKGGSTLTAIPALTTTSQLEKTAVFKWALHFTSTIQSTQQHCKLVPRFAIRYNTKGLDLIILQLNWLDEVAGMHGCKHSEDDRFF